MSFLTPIFLAGLLALGLPILYHLIRRTPRGHMPFSSLMFLSPSPPRITRRSRLDNILLLILRGLALILLILAFSRPFFRQASQLDIASRQSRHLTILLDVSASMRRADLWPRALEEVRKIIASLSANDRAALYTFDDAVHPLLVNSGIESTSSGLLRATIEAQLAELSPTWGATNLGAALVAAAESLSQPENDGALLEVFLVSDLQQGSDVMALETFQWPVDIRLEVVEVNEILSSNAGIQLIARHDDEPADAKRRVRIVNASTSSTAVFSVAWASADESTDPRISVNVPPGQSRIVRTTHPGMEHIDRLALEGDDHSFDNTFFLAPPRQETITVLYVGEEESNDPQGLRFYLERAFSGGGRRMVNVVHSTTVTAKSFQTTTEVRLAVVTTPLDKEGTRALTHFARAGGTVLCVPGDETAGASLAPLLGQESIEATEVDTEDYALLVDLDFMHPLFAPFADPRFSDFTNIHFWRHRRLLLSDPGAVDIPARFDDGAPALIEKPAGEGRILVLASGWHPADSQLARSSKFVPLLEGILAGPGESLEKSFFKIHDRVPLPDRQTRAGVWTVRKPDGTTVTLTPSVTFFEDTDTPGIYGLEDGGYQERFAVNVAAAESKTTPMDVALLENLGVQLSAPTEPEERRRQRRDLELESTQKLWRWLMGLALIFIIAETWLAGRLARPAGDRKNPTEVFS